MSKEMGGREAFEAWFFCPSNSLLAEWEEVAFEAFQAGAAYQRQVHAEHEGPDWSDGPEFEGWAGRSGQQPQGAEPVGWRDPAYDWSTCSAEMKKAHPERTYALTDPLYTTPQPSAGVVMPDANLHQAITHYEAALLAAFPSGSSGEVFNQWNAARRLIASLNGKGVGRG